MIDKKNKVERMLEMKSKVTEDVREEKQIDRGCKRGKAILWRMLERKSNKKEDDGEEKKKLQRMFERNSKVREDVREEKQHCRGC